VLATVHELREDVGEKCRAEPRRSPLRDDARGRQFREAVIAAFRPPILDYQSPAPRLAQEAVTRLMTAASKVAHDVSPYLYPTLQSIKHGGDEDAPPIKLENLSEYQLERLIERLSKG
jgi:hypothetical protein